MAFSKILSTASTRFTKPILPSINFSKHFQSNTHFFHSTAPRAILQPFEGGFRRVREDSYPFLTSGSSDFFTKNNDECFIYFRADMPGVNKNGLKFCVKDDVFYFEGQEKTDDEYGVEVGRSYGGSTPFWPPGLWDLDKIRVEMNNGELKITVPRKINIDILD